MVVKGDTLTRYHIKIYLSTFLNYTFPHITKQTPALGPRGGGFYLLHLPS